MEDFRNELKPNPLIDVEEANRIDVDNQEEIDATDAEIRKEMSKAEAHLILTIGKEGGIFSIRGDATELLVSLVEHLSMQPRLEMLLKLIMVRKTIKEIGR